MTKIDIGWIDGGLVHGRFTQSLLGVVMQDNALRKLVGSVHRSFGSGISKNRNSLVSAFLNGNSEYLLFMDSDTVWTIQDVYNMYDFCKDTNALAVTGVYILDDGAPAIFKKSSDGIGYRDITDFELHMNKYLEVDACGMGAFLAHRDLFLETKKDSASGPYWYHEKAGPDGFFSETVSYCQTIRDHGHKIYALTNVNIPHIKNIELMNSN